MQDGSVDRVDERPGGEAKESASSSGFLRMSLKGFQWIAVSSSRGSLQLNIIKAIILTSLLVNPLKILRGMGCKTRGFIGGELRRLIPCIWSYLKQHSEGRHPRPFSCGRNEGSTC